MTRFQFANCHLDYYPEREYCETVFPYGMKVPASPHDTEGYRAKAIDFGYGSNTMLMALHHEALHTILAEASGLKFSPVLRFVATDGKESLTPDEIGREEWIVASTQKTLMAMANSSTKGEKANGRVHSNQS